MPKSSLGSRSVFKTYYITSLHVGLTCKSRQNAEGNEDTEVLG